MFVANFRLKSAMQKATVFLRRVADYSSRHPFRKLEDMALEETAAFISERMPDALGFDTPKELLDFALGKAPATGLVAEFGVNQGGTIGFIARRMALRQVHGFDSFEGLPRDWSGNNMPAGFFSRGGRLPRVPDNVTLHRGWFEDTLPDFAAAHREPVAFLHIDCDLYSSTRTVLEALRDRLVPGTIIVFDEYFNYPNWRNHEHRAFRELVESERMQVSYLGYSYRQVAVALGARGAQDDGGQVSR